MERYALEGLLHPEDNEFSNACMRAVDCALAKDPEVATNKEVRAVRDVMTACTEAASNMSQHETMFRNTQGDFDASLAFGNRQQLDLLKSAKLAMTTAIDSVTSLDNLSEQARASTMIINRAAVPPGFAVGLGGREAPRLEKTVKLIQHRPEK